MTKSVVVTVELANVIVPVLITGDVVDPSIAAIIVQLSTVLTPAVVWLVWVPLINVRAVIAVKDNQGDYVDAERANEVYKGET